MEGKGLRGRDREKEGGRDREVGMERQGERNEERGRDIE